MNDAVLLCIAATSAEASRIAVRLGGHGIACQARAGDLRVVLEFGEFLRVFPEVWVERSRMQGALAVCFLGAMLP